MSNYFHTNSHDFKSNFSHYLKLLLKGKYDGICVRHYKKPIGVFALLEPPPPPSADSIMSEIMSEMDESLDVERIMEILKK